MTKLLDYAALQDRGIRYSKPHLWVKLSPSRNAWLESDVDCQRRRHGFSPAAGAKDRLAQ
jgi:hypothetical protein